MNDSTAQLLSNCTPHARCCVLGARGVVLTYEAISFLVGVSGNCLLLYSVLVSRVKPGILAHLLSIVAANFTAMSVWPMHVDYYRTGARWRFGLAGCAATSLVDQGCEYVAFYHSHSIAMTLYLKIVHEVALVDTACFIVARTAVVWVVVPSLMLLNVHLGRSKVAYDPAERTCETLAAQDAPLRVESPVRTGLMLLAVVYCYSHIVHKVRRSGASVHGTCKPCRELAITKMFVANFVILLVGHVPAAVLKMLRGDNGAGCQALASASLQHLHVVLSPPALVVVNTEMRAACGRLLQAGLRRLRAEHTTTTSSSSSTLSTSTSFSYFPGGGVAGVWGPTRHEQHQRRAHAQPDGDAVDAYGVDTKETRQYKCAHHKLIGRSRGRVEGDPTPSRAPSSGGPSTSNVASNWNYNEILVVVCINILYLSR